MGVSEKLVEQFSAALAEIEEYNASSSTTIDSELLGAVSDYIEVGTNGDETLKRLRSALLMFPTTTTTVSTATAAPATTAVTTVPVTKSATGMQLSSTAKSRELGLQRAQRLLVERLMSR